MSDACAEMLRRGDPDRFAAARLAGPLSGRLMALYAFNLEVARIPSAVSEPMLGEIRLQWWRDAVVEVFDGKPPRRHEVVAPLAEAIAAADLPREAFEALLDARSYDLAGPAFADRRLLDAYLDGTAGQVTRLAALALGATEAEAATARAHGLALGAGLLIRALPRLYARGADPIPTPEPPDRNALAEGRTPEPLRATLQAVAADALAALAEARRARLPAPLSPALLANWRGEAVLRAAARPGFALAKLDEPSEAARRWGLLWRVWLGRA